MIQLRFVGDAALCVDVDGVTPFDANARVHLLDEAIRTACVPGVRDLVPGMTTLTVHVDPLRTDLAAIESVLAMMEDVPVSKAPVPEPQDVRVHYGGEAGPDLEAVAVATGLTPSQVIEAHASNVYRVCFLGFLPGFAYLGLVPEALRLPRRSTPRTRVPAGAVAIADVFTGVYPADSPGGWHVIGHTDDVLFNPHHRQPARFSPGDAVRFVEV